MVDNLNRYLEVGRQSRAAYRVNTKKTSIQFSDPARSHALSLWTLSSQNDLESHCIVLEIFALIWIHYKQASAVGKADTISPRRHQRFRRQTEEQRYRVKSRLWLELNK